MGREARIDTIIAQQLFVPASLDDAAFLHHDDPPGIADSGQAMGHHQCGPAAHQAFEGLLDQRLGFCVEGRCGLIQDEHARVTDECPGNRQALFLAPGKPGTFFPQVGIQALAEN